MGGVSRPPRTRCERAQRAALACTLALVVPEGPGAAARAVPCHGWWYCCWYCCCSWCCCWGGTFFSTSFLASFITIFATPRGIATSRGGHARGPTPRERVHRLCVRGKSKKNKTTTTRTEEVGSTRTRGRHRSNVFTVCEDHSNHHGGRSNERGARTGGAVSAMARTRVAHWRAAHSNECFGCPCAWHARRSRRRGGGARGRQRTISYDTTTTTSSATAAAKATSAIPTTASAD